MTWYVDVHFKQRTVTEFLAAKKGAVTNSHKELNIWICQCMSVLLIRALLVAGLHEFLVLRKGQAEFSNARSSDPLTAVIPQALLQRAYELIRNVRRITARKLVTELSVTERSAKNTTDALGYSKVCAAPVPLNLVYCHKTVRWLMAKYFCHGSPLGMKYGSITLNSRDKVSGMTPSNFSSEEV